MTMVGQRPPAGCDELAGRQRTSFERRWWFFAGVWLVFLIQPLSQLWQLHHSVGQQVLGVTLIVIMAFAYVVLVPSGAFEGPRPRRVAALSTMVVSTALYGIVCGDAIAFAPYLVVSIVLLLPWSSGLPAAVA